MWDSEEGSTKNSRRVECQSKNGTHRYLHIITSNQKIYLKKKKCSNGEVVIING